LEELLRGGRQARRWGAAAGVLASLLMAAQAQAEMGAAILGAAQSKESAAPAASDSAADAKAAATRTVRDESGRRVTVPADVRRIVSLAPNLTETIYALGLEDRLVGDTDFCDTPAAAKQKPHVGGPQNPSLEAIVALHPDVVLAAEINLWDTVHALEHLGIPVYTSGPQTVEGMIESVRRLGELLGAEQQGAALAEQMQERLEALQAKLANRPLEHVLFVVQLDPLITIGQNTFIADALRWAGAESVVTSEQEWPQLSFEEVVRVQPDYIVVAPDQQESAAAALADLRLRQGWKDLEAVDRGHVATMSEEVNRPSPGMIGAIEQLAQELHPEAFANARAENAAKTNGKNR
jgi:iron complex transport system substrate-binding protein